MKQTRNIALALVALLGVGAAGAEDFPTIKGHKPSGYVLDSQGNVVRNSTGLCWRDGYYEDGMAIPCLLYTSDAADE